MSAVLVTGAAYGIGRACALRLARDRYDVVAVDIDARALDALPDGIARIAGDIRDDDVLDRAVTAGRERFGGFAGLVNNAGRMIRKPLTELSDSEWDEVIGLNLTAAMRCVRALVPDLRDTRGAVVNICSTRAHMSEPDTESYAASKGGILALTQCLSVSLGPDVRVNAVSPGWIDVSGAGPGREGEDLRAVDHEQHPAGRVGRPEDVAELVSLLLDSERSGFLTGAELIADGGMTRKMIYQP